MRQFLVVLCLTLWLAAGALAQTCVPPKIDLNTATVQELQALKGIGPTYAQKIVAGRPYKRKDELVSRKILPQGVYDKIKDQVISKQSK